MILRILGEVLYKIGICEYCRHIMQWRLYVILSLLIEVFIDSFKL